MNDLEKSGLVLILLALWMGTNEIIVSGAFSSIGRIIIFVVLLIAGLILFFTDSEREKKTKLKGGAAKHGR